MLSIPSRENDTASDHRTGHEHNAWYGLLLAFLAAVGGYNTAYFSERFAVGYLHTIFARNNIVDSRILEKLALGVIAVALGSFGVWLFKKEIEAFSRGWTEKGAPFLTVLTGVAKALNLEDAARFWTLFPMISSILMVAVAIHWIAGIVASFITGGSLHGFDTWTEGIVLAVSVAVFLRCSFHLKRDFVHSGTLGPRRPEAPYEALILFLSDPSRSSPPPAFEKAKAGTVETADEAAIKAAIEQFCQKLNEIEPVVPDWLHSREHAQYAAALTESCKETFGRHNWLMPTLSVLSQAHLGKLKHVFLVCSRESALAADAFETWIKRNLPGNVTASLQFQRLPEEIVDFAKSDEIQAYIDKCYAKIAREKLASSAILDLTGGTKECSVVSVISALKVGRAIMYIDTNSYEIKPFHPAIVQHASDAAGH